MNCLSTHWYCGLSLFSAGYYLTEYAWLREDGHREAMQNEQMFLPAIFSIMYTEITLHHIPTLVHSRKRKKCLFFSS